MFCCSLVNFSCTEPPSEYHDWLAGSQLAAMDSPGLANHPVVCRGPSVGPGLLVAAMMRINLPNQPANRLNKCLLRAFLINVLLLPRGKEAIRYFMKPKK